MGALAIVLGFGENIGEQLAFRTTMGENPEPTHAPMLRLEVSWRITPFKVVIRCFKLFIDGISHGMGTYDQQACDLTASDGESSPTWAVFLRREGQVELRKKSGG
jgi:hypothetical protein